MSDKDEPETNERDSDSDEDRDSDAEVDSEPAPAVAKKEAPKAKVPSGAKRRAPAAAASAGPSGSSPGPRVGLLVALALAVGGAGGWFGHIQQAKAAASKADAAAPVGSAGAAGPCAAWEKRICSSMGDNSAPCMQAKAAAELLTPSTCDAALSNLPAMLAKLKASRAPCEKLVNKLCSDLPPNSQTCKMVREKTPAFPTDRCEGMLKQYDEVIGQLRQMEEGAAAHAAPPGPVISPAPAH